MKKEKVLPEKIADVFIKLQSEIIWLHGHWIIFEQLYSKNLKTVELLNESAAMYFFITQKSLFDVVLMTLSRILDKPHFGKEKNLSLDLIIELLDEKNDSDLIERLKEILRKIDDHREVLKKYRNKIIAHKDLDLALEKAEFIPKINISDINNLLKSIREFMNECEIYFLDSETGYEFFSMTSDGKKLVSQLRKANAYDELEKLGLIERGYWIKKLRINESEN